MSKDCKVTAIIPSYNRANLLRIAIDSVRSQTVTNFKILIIDDGSTDETRSVVKGYAKADKRIDYFTMPQNKGVCHVLNKALELVDTKYMVQLDSDDWLQKDALESLLIAMEKQPSSIALAYGNHKSWFGPKRIKLHKNRSFTSSQKYELLA